MKTKKIITLIIIVILSNSVTSQDSIHIQESSWIPIYGNSVNYPFSKTKLFENPTYFYKNDRISRNYTLLKPNDTLRLISYLNGVWFVKKGNLSGYVYDVDLQKTDSIEMFKKFVKKKTEKIAELKRKKRALKYGKVIGEKLLDGKYWIGMTEDMAIISMGRPYRINKSVGSWGVHKQWVYYDRVLYLYFENGILRSYQTR